CCGLANNAHGFPGHCYVAWSSSQLSDLDHIEAKGYVPRYAMDQITSLFRDVPGLVLANASQGNLRNFDAVVAIVDQSTFDKTRELGLVWSQDRFRVGERDCVAYTDAVARCIGLRTPDRHYRYPQNYIAELKKMNCRKAFFIGKHRPSV
ncbi:MAG: hypothetical protein K2Z81_12955, partial [Cyanobacteria bacterium]|nr:hypothetical protein [Cyanobacteriota bacterium]